MSRSRFARAEQPVVVVTTALSAFLLFTIELLFARLVLPVFGGSPEVWVTALWFYSAVLLLGYLYAHLVATRLSHRTGAFLHAVLAVLAVVAITLGPRDVANLRVATMDAGLNVLLVLILVSGAPAFLLSTTTPLISAYYADHHKHYWWLYATSNGASLGALVIYPLLIEPLVPLYLQRTLVTVLFIGYLAAMALIFLVMPSSLRGRGFANGDWGDAANDPAATMDMRDNDRAADAAERDRVVAGRLGLRRQLLWLLAAAVPAGLLCAVTTILTTDLTPTPLLWALPLAIYLGSFVVAFSERGRRILPLVELLAPAAVTLMWVPYVAFWHELGPSFVLMLLVSFAVLAVAIHGRLALDRPGPQHLTRFYVVVALGGFVATGFAAVMAPILFPDTYEYPILLVAGAAVLALLPGLRTRAEAELPREVEHRTEADTGQASGAWPSLSGRSAAYLAMCILPLATVLLTSPATKYALLVGLAVGAAAIALSRSHKAFAIVTAAVVFVGVAAGAYHLSSGQMVRERNFFGIVEVSLTGDGSAHIETHGTTVHGAQFGDERCTEPTLYYAKSGPLGDVMRDVANRLPDGASTGVVGLGVGTLAAYARPGDTMRFFEIDPAVVQIAQDPRLFSYLARAASRPQVVLGDGRLSLERESPASFDLLVLDAFSSDAIPLHLLTREAVGIYARALRGSGIMAFHLSNSYYDLVPAVAATARSLGLDARFRHYVPTAEERSASGADACTWLVVGRPQDMAIYDRSGWSSPRSSRVLEDDFADELWLLSF